MNYLKDILGISIITKDRWDDLKLTLSQLESFGLTELQTVVMDDGSSKALPTHYRSLFPWVNFQRHEKSSGVSLRRNQVAGILSTQFILQLDDDSAPIYGHLDDACNWLKSHPKIVALGLSIALRDHSHKFDVTPNEPFAIKDFIGCGVILRRDIFLGLGGYEQRLSFFGEEPEFCIRAFSNGYEIYSYPAITISHRVTSIARNQRIRSRLFIRNEMLIALWHFPFPESIFRSVRLWIAIMLKNPELNGYPIALLQGFLEAPFYYLIWKKENKRLPYHRFLEWKRLPLGVSVLQKK